MSIASQLDAEYNSAISCYAAFLERAARQAGDFLGHHAAITIAEREFKSEYEKDFHSWLRMIAYWQTDDR